MHLPALDIPTLCVVSAVVIAFSGSLLIVARGRDDGAVPLVFWGCALLAGAAGIILLSLEPFTTLPVFAAANVMMLTGSGLSWMGARVFSGRKSRPWLLAAGPVMWLISHLALASSIGQVPGVIAFLAGAAYILLTAAELWRGRSESLPTRVAAITLLVMHGAIYLVQAAEKVVQAPGPISNGLFLFLLMEALLHTIGMAFLFLALMKERAELQSTQRLRALATTDGLTGLGNRRHFDQMLEQEVRRAARTKVPLSLLMIDVDHFKLFNDSYGHRAGDRCLQAVASVIRRAVNRPADLALRYGGEEFAVLLPGTGATGAVSVANAIRRGVELLGTEHARNPHRLVTVSVGAACTGSWAGWADADHLVIAADQALYAAKAAGRNMTMQAIPPTSVAARPDLDAIELRSAVAYRQSYQSLSP